MDRTLAPLLLDPLFNQCLSLFRVERENFL
jgi:hypothetical protein